MLVLLSTLPSLQAEEIEIAQQRVRVSLFLSPGVSDPGIRELNHSCAHLLTKCVHLEPQVTAPTFLEGPACLPLGEKERR